MSSDSELVTFKLEKEFVKAQIDPLVSKKKGLPSRAAVIRQAVREFRKTEGGK